MTPAAADLAARLEAVFNALMPAEKVPARQRTRLNTAAWDSLFQLTVVLAIEQEFNIRLSDDEAIDVSSFESALQIVGDRLASG